MKDFANLTKALPSKIKKSKIICFIAEIGLIFQRNFRFCQKKTFDIESLYISSRQNLISQIKQNAKHLTPYKFSNP